MNEAFLCCDARLSIFACSYPLVMTPGFRLAGPLPVEVHLPSKPPRGSIKIVYCIPRTTSRSEALQNPGQPRKMVLSCNADDAFMGLGLGDTYGVITWAYSTGIPRDCWGRKRGGSEWELGIVL